MSIKAAFEPTPINPKIVPEAIQYYFKGMYLGGISDEEIERKCKILGVPYEEICKLKPKE